MISHRRHTVSHRSYRRQRGFTLQELVVSLAIGSGVTTGATSLYTLVQDTKLTTAANELVAHMNLARSEAIMRGHEIVLCASGGGSECAQGGGSVSWQNGYQIYANTDNDSARDANESTLRVHNGYGSGIAVRSNRGGKLTFKPTGVSPGSTITVAFCGTGGRKQERYVVVQNGGRARVAQRSDSNVRC
ncbi:MAG: GspH/FimT family pseudopilin [Gammaproteobacteria bacterium]